MNGCRRKAGKKICSKCGVPQDPVKDFYHRPDTGGRMNVCKTCCVRAAVKRKQDKRAGKVAAPVIECTHENEPHLHCTACDTDKPQCKFTERPDRPGKYYKQCKTCKAEIEKQRRAHKPLKPELFTHELFENEHYAA